MVFVTLECLRVSEYTPTRDRRAGREIVMPICSPWEIKPLSITHNGRGKAPGITQLAVIARLARFANDRGRISAGLRAACHSIALSLVGRAWQTREGSFQKTRFETSRKNEVQERRSPSKAALFEKPRFRTCAKNWGLRATMLYTF